jgi:large subunit ribosomal protein L32e
MALKKKTHPKFNVPNYGAKSRSRVPERWRKQRGDDNKKRIKKNFMGAEPTIGYGNPEQLKGVRENGRRTVLVHDVGELQAAIDNAKGTDITLSSSLSSKKKAIFTKVARDHDVQVTNGVIE